jgi:hypothetical protein
LKTYTIREEYAYDHASRLRFTRHHIATSTTQYPTSGWVVTSAPLYDELDRLADKRLHASNYKGTSPVDINSIGLSWCFPAALVSSDQAHSLVPTSLGLPHILTKRTPRATSAATSASQS